MFQNGQTYWSDRQAVAARYLVSQTIFGIEAVIRRCSIKKMFLNIFQNSQENTSFIKKETPVQVLSCEFCKTFKNTFYSASQLTLTCSKSRIETLEKGQKYVQN